MFVLHIQVTAETSCLRGDGLYQVASYSSCTLVILQNYLVSAMKDDLNPQFCSVSPVNLLASVFQRFDTELIHGRMSVLRQDGLLLSSVLPYE